MPTTTSTTEIESGLLRNTSRRSARNALKLLVKAMMSEMKKMNQFVQTEGLRTENASTQTDEEEVANQVIKKNFLHIQSSDDCAGKTKMRSNTLRRRRPLWS